MLVEAGAVERAVGALRRDDLPRPRVGLELGDDLSAGGTRERVLAPDAQLGIRRVMGVVREHDDPILAVARVLEQAPERVEDALCMRVGESAGHEVVEHVDDHEGLHPSTFRRDREAAA